MGTPGTRSWGVSTIRANPTDLLALSALQTSLAARNTGLNPAGIAGQDAALPAGVGSPNTPDETPQGTVPTPEADSGSTAVRRADRGDLAEVSDAARALRDQLVGTQGAENQAASRNAAGRYATGGEVGISFGEGRTPEETLRNAETARRAALAPAEPSGQDQKVAAKASQLAAQARREIQEANREEGGDESQAPAQAATGISSGPNTAAPAGDVLGATAGASAQRTGDVQPDGSPTSPSPSIAPIRARAIGAYRAATELRPDARQDVRATGLESRLEPQQPTPARSGVSGAEGTATESANPDTATRLAVELNRLV